MHMLGHNSPASAAEQRIPENELGRSAVDGLEPAALQGGWIAAIRVHAFHIEA
jgi:hypothetical protein